MSYKRLVNSNVKMLPRYTEVLVQNHNDFSNKTKGVVLGGSIFKDRPQYCVYLYREDHSYYIDGQHLVPTGVTKTAENFDKQEPVTVPAILRELDLA